LQEGSVVLLVCALGSQPSSDTEREDNEQRRAAACEPDRRRRGQHALGRDCRAVNLPSARLKDAAVAGVSGREWAWLWRQGDVHESKVKRIRHSDVQ